MSDQPLLDWQPPAQQHSRTSLAAADLVKPNAATLRTLVLEHLRKHGPSTDEAIADALGMQGNTQRPRRRELQLMGLVVEHDEEGRTRSGRRATRWKAVAP